MRLSPPFFLLLAGLVSGCAQEPFVDQGVSVTVQKQPNASQQGAFEVCHSDRTPESEVIALAEEQCAAHGLKAISVRKLRWQCRATSPHKTEFRCIDPALRYDDGTYVNPRVPAEVKAWEKRTGKKAPSHGAAAGPVVVAPAPESVPPPAASLPGPAAPPPAPISAMPPALTPADIAGKPAMSSQPLRLETPPPAPLPVDGGFKLPVGSWGDHFQD